MLVWWWLQGNINVRSAVQMFLSRMIGEKQGQNVHYGEKKVHVIIRSFNYYYWCYIVSTVSYIFMTVDFRLFCNCCVGLFKKMILNSCEGRMHARLIKHNALVLIWMDVYFLQYVTVWGNQLECLVGTCNGSKRLCWSAIYFMVTDFYINQKYDNDTETL